MHPDLRKAVLDYARTALSEAESKIDDLVEGLHKARAAHEGLRPMTNEQARVMVRTSLARAVEVDMEFVLTMLAVAIERIERYEHFEDVGGAR